jgi:L-iditol 2-dehydrogenase
MKAILVKEIGSFEIVDRPTLIPKDNEVLIKVEVTGLCRTDLKIIEVGHRDLVLPRIPGEEVVGVIKKTGKAVKNFTAGQRVYVYPGTSCGKCKPCLSRAENLCVDMEIMGFHRHGGFAEFTIAPEASLIPVPEGLKPEIAVFAEPLSCCLNAIELSGLKKGETIGIWGGGPAGNLLQRAALAIGAEPTVIEPDQHRAEYSGAVSTLHDELFDVCIIAVGSVDAYQHAITRLGPRGRLVVFSGLSKQGSIQQVDYNQLHYYEQTLIGAYGCSIRHSVLALEYLSKGKIEVESLISHKLPLWELKKALDMVKNRSGMKILLYP